jgi:hypothetical protein
MPLFNTACKNAKSKEKPYKLADEKGMFLLANPKGSKYFRMKYRFGGTEKPLHWGYIMKPARVNAARKQLADGIDPGITRKIEKAGSMATTSSTGAGQRPRFP